MSLHIAKIVTDTAMAGIKTAVKEVKILSKEAKQTTKAVKRAQIKAAREMEKFELKQMLKEDTKQLKTEDLGKIFEMGICIKKNIPYHGSFKYSLSKANDIASNLDSWNYPYPLLHTAEGQGQYDFRGRDDDSVKLSAKTNKKGGKVSPQILGQPTKKTFCKHFELCETMKLVDIKSYILENVASMLVKYYEFTFDADILYYNEHKNTILFIKNIQDIPWSSYDIQFTKASLDPNSDKFWNESTSISVKEKNIGEFQIHNHRNCIKFRWNFENLLVVFKECFVIKQIYPILHK